MVAVIDGNADAVTAAIAAGAEVRHGNDAALRRAARDGHAEIVNRLLAAGAGVHTGNIDILTVAARHGHADVIRVLLAASPGADLSNGDAVAAAASRGHTNVVRILLAAGGNPLVAWLGADRKRQRAMVETLDACADVMTPGQRVALAKESGNFFKLRAWTSASNRYHHLQR